VERYRPLHVSLVGGDPLVRYRELETLVPLLLGRRLHVQIVTSAFRPLPREWARMKRLSVAVSIDGLPPEHDARRAPATYERILRNIAGHHVTIHCTITGQMMKETRYLERFLMFWSPRKEIRRIWFSIFTPQQGDALPEMLTAEERSRAVAELLELWQRYPKLDMRKPVIEAFASPPSSPEECVFAQTTQTISADLRTSIEPCQFGGKPDCSSCGCFASMGMAAVANHRLFGWLPIGPIFWVSRRVGQAFAVRTAAPRPAVEFRIIQ
jgi:sulfatase maturation enzyme AslB (radical SAM superfamily)